MPELAEVEYYRRCWNCGLGEEITGIALHSTKRIFRTVQVRQLRRLLPSAVLLSSEARGKQLLFRFSPQLWLGLHLGMTGKLSVAPPKFRPGKHDHLVIYQRQRALVFADPRQFGRVQFAAGPLVPEWWSKLSQPVTAPSFKPASMQEFLSRHRRLPIKATLLLQAGFPGVGNWMADEILWRAKLNPRTTTGSLNPAQRAALWKSLRFVCRGALQYVAQDFSDPPSSWFFHQRWRGGGRCPIHDSTLVRETIGGRTTAWCRQCQPAGVGPAATGSG